MAAIVPLTEPVQALLQLLIAKHSMTDDEVRQQSTSATSDVFGIAHGALPASRQTPHRNRGREEPSARPPFVAEGPISGRAASA